jgi:hypothetical protein
MSIDGNRWKSNEKARRPTPNKTEHANKKKMPH